MLETLFTTFNEWLNASPLLSLTAAFLWGVLSLLLSPCHLSSIPLVVGFIDKHGITIPKRAFVLSLLFSLGILITITAVGLVTSLAGRMLGDIGTIGNLLVAAIFLFMGLYLLNIVPMPFSGMSQPKFKGKGVVSALLMGLFFGLAVGPCTFAFLAPILGIILNISTDRFLFGLLLILFYATGHCLIIVLAGTFTSKVQSYLNWNEHSKGAVILKRVCGCLVFIAGIYMILKTI